MTVPRRRGLALAVLALPALVVSLDLSVLLLALPEISADLGASATEQLWITDAYGFMVAGFLVTMGTLGDRIGRRRLLLDRRSRLRRCRRSRGAVDEPGAC